MTKRLATSMWLGVIPIGGAIGQLIVPIFFSQDFSNVPLMLAVSALGSAILFSASWLLYEPLSAMKDSLGFNKPHTLITSPILWMSLVGLIAFALAPWPNA